MTKTPVIVYLSYLECLRAVELIQYTACMMYICEIERTFSVTTEYFRSLLIYSVKPENRPKLH